MVTNVLDNFRFATNKKVRKSPRIALLSVIVATVIITTVTLNLYVTAKQCEVKSSGGASPFGMPTALGESNEVSRAQSPVTGGPALQINRERGAPLPPYIFDKQNGRITFPRPTSRGIIGQILEHMQLKTGFEVGVRQGEFSKFTLNQWSSCTSYHLVDLWGNPNQHLGEAVDHDRQEGYMEDAFNAVSSWKHKISHCKNYSTVCAGRVSDGQFDYGYIDARHDFKAVYEDLQYWYPKIKTGGVMAGHDYMTDRELKVYDNIDWSYNQDGTLDYARQAVKGAVNLFFAERQQFVAPCSPHPSFSSWVMYKAAPGTNKPNDLMHFIDFQCFIEDECLPISDRMALNVRLWEALNPGFLAVVWTREILGWFLQEDVDKYSTSYQGNPMAFREMIKLKVVHKFGGTYIDEKLIPVHGLQGFVDAWRGTDGLVGFCELGIKNPESSMFTKSCEKVSRMLISGKKGDAKIAGLASQHEKEFSAAGKLDEEASQKLTEKVLPTSVFNVFTHTAAFPCDSFSLTPDCVAQHDGQTELLAPVKPHVEF